MHVLLPPKPDFLAKNVPALKDPSEDMTILGSAMLPANMTAYEVGLWSGRIVFAALAIAGLLKCFAITRRPTTNTKCVLALMLVLFTVLLSTVLSTAASLVKNDSAVELLGLARALSVLALLLVALVIGILGLLECQDRRSAYKQGPAQATWALVLSGVLVTLTLAGGMSNFSGLFTSMTAPQLGEPGEPIELEEHNFRFRTPGTPWKSCDTNSLGRRAMLAFERSGPDMSLSVMADKYGAGFNTELLAQSGKGVLRKGFTKEMVLEQKPVTIGGLDGIQLETRAVANGKELVTVQWYCLTNGFGYQLISMGPWRNRGQVLREAGQLFSLFECIDPARVTEESGPRFETNFVSPHYSYSVVVTNSEWRQWNALQRQFAWFDFAARREAGIYMAVVPVWVGEEIDEEALRSAMLTTMNIAYPDENLTDRKMVAVGEVTGVQFDYERYVYEVPYRYRLRVLQNSGFAYLVCAWAERHKTNYSEALDDAVSRLRFDARAGSPPDLGKFSKPEKETRAVVLNQAGAFYYEKAKDFARAKKLFETAYATAPEPLFFENTLMAWRQLKKPAEALAFAESQSGVYGSSLKVRAIKAFLQGEAGKNEEALAGYSSLFKDGFQDIDVFAEYIRLLDSQKRYDEALDIIRKELKKEESVAFRVLEANVYSDKGDSAEAIRLLQIQRERAPFVPEVAHALVLAHLDAREYEKARSICEELLKSGEPSWETYVLKGRSEIGLERFADAKGSYESARRLNPGDPEIRKSLEWLAGIVGKGDDTRIRNPIAPVEIPSMLLGLTARLPPPAYAKEYGAYYARRVTALQFSKEQGWTRTDYSRVHILDSSGVNAFSTVEFSVDLLSEEIYVNSVRVQQSSGSVITGMVSRCYLSDDLDSGLATHRKKLMIPVSGLRPGCMLELMVTRRDIAHVTKNEEIPFLALPFSQGCPVRQSICYVAGPPAALKWKGSQALEARSIEGGRYWTVEDPPVLRPEPLRPPVDEFAPLLWLGDASAQWPSMATKYLSSISERMVLNAELREQARALAAGAETDAGKVAVLARHVQTNYTYKALEFGSRSTIPETPAEMALNKYGDCKDHAVMLQQMLEAAGVSARLALVNSSAAVQKELPSLDQFDHMVVYVPSCGNAAFVDCTQKGAWLAHGPPDGLSGREALILDKANPRFEKIPDGPEVPSTIESARIVRVGATNQVTVEETLQVTGIYAGGMREQLLELPAANRRIYLQQHLRRGQAELESWDIEDLENPAAPLRVKLVYSLRNQYDLVDGRLLGTIPALFERFYLQYEQVENRVSPVQLKYPLKVTSKVTVKGEAGFQPQKPSSPAQSLDEPFLKASSKEDLRGPELHLEFTCTQKPGTFKASDYAAFRDACSRALALLERRVALVPKTDAAQVKTGAG